MEKSPKPANKEITFHFQIRDEYDEREIEDLLETLERRGADYEHLGKGLHQVSVPVEILWTPFYQAVAHCNSTDIVAEQCYLTGQDR